MHYINYINSHSTHSAQVLQPPPGGERRIHFVTSYTEHILLITIERQTNSSTQLLANFDKSSNDAAPMGLDKLEAPSGAGLVFFFLIINILHDIPLTSPDSFFRGLSWENRPN